MQQTTSMLNKAFLLIAFAILPQQGLSRDIEATPIFLYGDGAGDWSFGQSDSHSLERTAALAIISGELKNAKVSFQQGPLLLDGFTTKEIALNYISPQDPELPVIAHPFFFDFYIPELGIAVKYVGAGDCSRLEFGEYNGIDYWKVDLIGAIQVLREKLGEISPVPFAIFYDPMSQVDGETTSAQLHAQVSEFLRWTKKEVAAGHLPFKVANQPFTVPDIKKLEKRVLAQDKTLKGTVRIAAIEWLGAVRDQSALPILKDALETKDEWINRAAISALGQAGGNDAESLLISYIPKRDHPRWLIYEALDAANPAWTKSGQAQQMLSGWNFESPDEYFGEDDLGIAFQIDPEQTLKRSRELFRTGQLFAGSYNEFLRHCTLNELELILGTLSGAIYFDDEAAMIVSRLDPNWRDNPLTRNAVRKQIEALLTLEDAEDTLKMSNRINLINSLNPQWRINSKTLKKMKSFVARMKQEATTSREKEIFTWAAMALKIKEADQLVAFWWNQHREDGNFRDNFIRSYLFLGQNRYFPPLKQSLKWNDRASESLRTDVLTMFGELGGPEVYPSIMRGLSDNSSDVRRAAVIAAGKQKMTSSIHVLEEILRTSDNAELVVDSARALSQIGKPASVRLLAQALDKWLANPGVACQIIDALSAWNTGEVESAMKRFVNSATPWAEESPESDRNRFYFNDIRPNAGIEGAIRWAIRNNRKTMAKDIAPYIDCSSPRHRALAQAAAYYFADTN